MNTVERFAHYAMAFEQALVTDEWSAVAECLSPMRCMRRSATRRWPDGPRDAQR